MRGNSFDQLGIRPSVRHGQERLHCPRCEGRNKTLSIDLDRGLYHCFRCDWSGRAGGPDNWLTAHLDQIQEAQCRRRAGRERAAQRASEIWSATGPAMWHDYLKAKRVLPLGIRQRDKNLVVPLRDADGNLQNVQLIDPGGNKLFLKGGRKRGLFCPIGGPVENSLYICEGFATGATIHMHLDPHKPVFVAFDAGNLLPVAMTLRSLYPGIAITIAADNDCWGKRNTGLDKARHAAAAVGAELIYPTFESVDIESRPTDFNDLYRLGGL